MRRHHYANDRWPPLNYRKRNGTMGTVKYDEGDWPKPFMVWNDTHDWVPIGWAPKPKTTHQNFMYHLSMGLLMHYPLLDVLHFSWKYRKSFKR